MTQNEKVLEMFCKEKKWQGKQYIYIKPECGSEYLVNCLKDEFPALKDSEIIYNNVAIFITLEHGKHYEFCQKELQAFVANITPAVIGDVVYSESIKTSQNAFVYYSSPGKLSVEKFVSDFFEEEVEQRYYGRYLDNPDTLFEFEDSEDLITWLKYDDDLSKRHKFSNDNSHIRIAATQAEVDKVFDDDTYTYKYDSITNKTIVEKK